MRYKIQISAPAIFSIAVFFVGILAILLYSLNIISGESGTGFVISISLQSLSIYLLSLAVCILLIFKFFKRKEK